MMSLMVLGGFFLLALVILGIGFAVLLNRRSSSHYPADLYQQGVTTPNTSPPLQLDADLDVAIQQLLAQNQKINAVKLVRERTGLGLKEAKDYVERVESLGGFGYLPPTAQPALIGTEVDAAVHELLARNQKINAIKLVREQTGLGLKEAKDYVETLERRGI